MKTFATFASAAVLAATLAAATAPAHATVIAQFSPDATSADYKWIKNNSGGELISVGNPADTTATAVATHFSFVPAAFADFASLSAVFTLDATAAQGNPAIFAAGTWTQTGLNGSFAVLYTGANQTIDGVNLVSGVTHLFDGVFTSAQIVGAGGSGSATLAFGGAAAFSSDVVDLSGIPGSRGLTFNLGSVSPTFDASTGKALNSFTANGGGSFSAAAPIPEPAAWGLMIGGFGMAGAMLRRRKAVAAAG
ncbi:MAG: PEPxxWA-CTERM sorting domain-containing protein [Phenylobacterium sp.]